MKKKIFLLPVILLLLTGCASQQPVELIDSPTTSEVKEKQITAVDKEIENWKMIGTQNLKNPEKARDFFVWDRGEMYEKYDELSAKSLEAVKTKDMGDVKFDIIYAQTLEVLFLDTNTAGGYVGIIANTDLKPDGSKGEVETKELLAQIVFKTENEKLENFKITEFEFRENNGQIELLNPETQKYDINSDGRVWATDK